MRPQSSVELGEVSTGSKSSDKANCYSPAEASAMLAPTFEKSPEEREFVVDSGASMHMLSKKDLSSSELDTLRKSRNVVMAYGEEQTNEGAHHDVDLFETVQILDDTLAVLSSGKLCDDHGKICEWASGRKPRLTKQGEDFFKTENFVPLVVPGLSIDSGSVSSSTIVTAGLVKFIFKSSIGAK